MPFKRFIIGALMLLPLAACGSNAFDSLADKNSDAAKKEAAQMAIDSGDYASAISILAASCPGNICPDQKTGQQLAAAYMGQAGLNVMDLAKIADQATSSSATNADFTTITKSLSYTSTSATAIANAVATLQANPPASGASTDQKNDYYMQLGVASATSAIVQIGTATSGFDANGIPTSCNGNCTTTPPTISASTATNVATSLVSASTSLANISTGSNNTASQAVNDLVNNIAAIGTSGTTCNTYSNSTSAQSTATTTNVANGVQNYVTTCVK
ncbi:MAG: hypothetical protein HZA04_09615 [Nitrospinae bacterium]|nr:hypothetical protein [Nitrospinota bacterium]